MNRYCTASVNYNHALDESDFHLDKAATNPIVVDATSGAVYHVGSTVSSVQRETNFETGSVGTGSQNQGRPVAILESSRKHLGEDRHKHANCGLLSTDTSPMQRSRSTGNGSRGGGNSSRHRVVTDRKAIVVLASVLVAFAVCWIPYFVLFTVRPFLTWSSTPYSTRTSGFGHNSSAAALARSFDSLLTYSDTISQNSSFEGATGVSDELPEALGSQKPEIPVVLDEFCLWLGYANSFVNPFLYAFYNSAFRRGMRRLLVCKHRRL